MFAKVFTVLVISSLTWSESLAQANRYVVFFTDKKDNGYSLDEPLQFLSQRAIERRMRQGLSVDSLDLPVTPEYVNQLKDLVNVEVHHVSRWFNAVLVEALPEDFMAIQDLNFVKSITLVAPGKRLNTVQMPATFPTRLAPTGTSTSTLQNGMIETELLHAADYRGQGIWIAVFDSWFEGANASAAFDHVLTGGNLLATWDFVRNVENVFDDGETDAMNDHGTRVWSTLAAKVDSTFSGTAPLASYLLAVTEDNFSEYRIEEFNWLFAAEWADSAGVDIVNTSLGYTYFDDAEMDYTYADMDGVTAIVTQAANLLAQRGVLLVSSAGNSGNDPWRYIGAPADSRNVIAVGAVTNQSNKANFSSFGPTADGRIKPDLAALGVLCAVINGNNERVFSSGTSFSSPIIAGYAASLWSKHPQISSSQLMDSLLTRGHQFQKADNLIGYGIPNYKPVAPLAIDDEILQHPKFNSIYPNPFEERIHWVTNHPTSWTWKLYDTNGRLVHQGITDKKDVHRLTILPAPPQGLYYLHLRSAEQSHSFRLLKK